MCYMRASCKYHSFTLVPIYKLYKIVRAVEMAANNLFNTQLLQKHKSVYIS